MLPLWDMLAKAQNGHFADLMAKQFALSQAQVQAAVDALLPAFSQALKLKAATDPFGMTAFLNAMTSGNYAGYFEDAARAFSPEGTAAGNSMLDQIFGSSELSRAVAEQAARATGIGGEIMRAMLPALAAVMTGGFLKQFTEAASRPGGAANAGPAADPLSQAWANNPWNKAFAAMWKPVSGAAPNPMANVFERWAAGFQPPPNPAPQPETAPANPYAGLFGAMFETGRQTQEEYRRATEALFDQFARSVRRS